MGRVYVIEPSAGWHAGDRAYCVRGTMLAKPPLVEGRVYEVERVIPTPGFVGCGLALTGVEVPCKLEGFWSHRFIKIGDRGGNLLRIDTASARTAMAVYEANTGIGFGAA